MTTSKIQGNPYGASVQSRPTEANKSAAKVASPGVGDVSSLGSVKPTSTAKGSRAAEIDVSERAKSYQKALEIARATPEIREDRVAALKKHIQEGTYKINSGAIADGMAREAIMDHLAETEGR